MSTTKETLWLQLLDLIGNDAGQSIQTVQTISSPQDNGSISDIDLSLLPEITAQTCDDILSSFQQLNYEKTQLADELLACYNQLNTTFEATIAVARCKSTNKAISVLTDQIARAVNSQFSFYFGPLAQEVSQLPGNQENFETIDDIITRAQNTDNLIAGHNFLQQYEEQLRQLIADTTVSKVAMVDYHGPTSMDNEGRGNVLIVRLRTHQEVNDSGLVFVRDKLQKLFVAMDMNLAAALGRMGSVVVSNIIYSQKLHQSYLQTITSLARAMEAKDSYTSGHSTRVAQLACDLGRYIKLDDKQIQQLEWAGLLHDVGKIGIRDEVLSKPGKLTKEEFDHIKTHPVISFNVLEPIEALHDIMPAVKHHHEHFDGNGYPDGLQGQAIPLHARILQIADVWDALTSTRSYRQAMSQEQAKKILRAEAGTTMDMLLVTQFLEMMKKNEPQKHSNN